MTTVPAHSFSAPARAAVIAAARFMPGVCGVLTSSSLECTTRTPCRRHFDSVGSGITASPSYRPVPTATSPTDPRMLSTAHRTRSGQSRHAFPRGVDRMFVAPGARYLDGVVVPSAAHRAHHGPSIGAKAVDYDIDRTLRRNRAPRIRGLAGEPALPCGERLAI